MRVGEFVALMRFHQSFASILRLLPRLYSLDLNIILVS